MKELFCISGKGGIGKTSLVASFASMAENCVLAECDKESEPLRWYGLQGAESFYYEIILWQELNLSKNIQSSMRIGL